jgi:GNAT superfamily N-acetyltransferase
MLEIRQATSEDASWLQSSFDNLMGWTKPSGYFEDVCQLQAQDEVVLLIAIQDKQYAGHMKIVWQPEYTHFRDQNIPEIQDLNVRPDVRRQGIATRLLDKAEKQIGVRSNYVGIGFGLYADYGSAQRLYIKRGYIPDGHGVFYDNTPVKPGLSVPVDDGLVLYLVKQFA